MLSYALGLGFYARPKPNVRLVVPSITDEPYQVTAVPCTSGHTTILAAFLGPILLDVIMFIRLHFFHAHLLQTLHYEVVEFIMVVAIK